MAPPRIPVPRAGAAGGMAGRPPRRRCGQPASRAALVRGFDPGDRGLHVNLVARAVDDLDEGARGR